MIKYHLHKIAVATDFTSTGDHAVQFATGIARQCNTSLDIIHAVSPAESRNKKALFVGTAYNKLRALRDAQMAGSVNVKIFARVGEVTDFIYRYCVDNNIDLLVIGIIPGKKKLFGQSKGFDIIMKIECPVLSIPPAFNIFPFRGILFPVRDVEGTEDKLIYTKPFAGNAKLHMVCLGEPSDEKIRELMHTAKQVGLRFHLPDQAENFDKMHPSHVIAAARKMEDDLIVINATTEKEWYNLLGENYTAHILKESDVAVLSITHKFQSCGTLIKDNTDKTI